MYSNSPKMDNLLQGVELVFFFFPFSHLLVMLSPYHSPDLVLGYYYV